nr:13563_t:CDS:2 [Entrophospora candida]
MGTNGRPEKDFEHVTGTSRRSHQEDISGNSEVGRDFANRYGGLFSEKDWKCPTCSNINWARRTECNQCKTSKPGLETSLGTREGRGGGFLERDEVVEYKQSRSAEKDDEWDEFDNVKSHNERSSSSKEHWSGKYSRRRSSRSQSPLPPLSSHYNDHSLSRDRNSHKNRSISREHRSSGQSSSWDNHSNKRRSSIIDVHHRHRSKSRSRERKRNSHGSKSRSTSRNRKRSYKYRSCSRSRSPPGRQYQNRSLSRSKSSERRY